MQVSIPENVHEESQPLINDLLNLQRVYLKELGPHAPAFGYILEWLNLKEYTTLGRRVFEQLAAKAQEELNAMELGEITPQPPPEGSLRDVIEEGAKITERVNAFLKMHLNVLNLKEIHASYAMSFLMCSMRHHWRYGKKNFDELAQSAQRYFNRVKDSV